MKIVATSNYALESVADFLVAENIKDDRVAQIMCDALNEKYGGGDYFYQVKADDYRLWRGMEELV